MTDNISLEKALETTLQRLVESRLVSLRQELTESLQREFSGALASSAGTAAAASTAASAPNRIPALNQAVGRILQPTAQAEIMAACLQGAAAFAGRCALFVRRGEAFAFWRGERFRDDTAAAARSITVDANQGGIFKEVADSQQTAAMSRAPGVIPAPLENALGPSADGAICLSPVVVQGRVVAALYADAGSNAGSVDASALEILSKVTGLSLETAAARGSRPAPAVDKPAAKPAEETAAPAAIAQEVPPVAQAPLQGSFAASIPATPATAPSVAPPPETEALPEPDREAHRKAHRFARVAVQDLLSYHKNKIEQARKNKNLYAILRDDIEKTRENYRQRFGNTAARSYDYLHYELVLKLAGNDPEALGATYPGAMQE